MVVFGAGGVGLNIVQAANLVGGYPVIAVDIFDNRLALAKQIGATHIINSKTQNAKVEIDKIIGIQNLDHFVDNTGQPTIIELGYEVTKPQGKVTLVGVPRKGDNINIYSLPLHFGKGLVGSHGGEAIPNLDIPRYQNLFRANRIKLRELLTERYPLNDINTAIENMRSGKTSGRCLVSM